MSIEIRVARASSVAEDLASIADRWAEVREAPVGADIPIAGLGAAIGSFGIASSIVLTRVSQSRVR